MTTATMPAFTFDPAAHVYKLYGRRLESVTEVLAENGWINSDWFRPIHSLRGVRAHLYCQWVDEGEDKASVFKIAAADKGFDFGQGFEPYWPDAPEQGLDGCLESWIKFREWMRFDVLDNETPLYHPKMLYAGTPDRRASYARGQIILDLKTGGPEPWNGFQLAAYAGLYLEANAFRRFGVYLQSDGARAITKEYDDYSDFSIFSAMLACTRARAKHRIKPIKGDQS